MSEPALSKQDEAAAALLASMRLGPQPMPADEEFPARADTDRMAEPGAYDGNDLPWIEPEHYHASSRLSRTCLVRASYQSPAHVWAAIHEHAVTSRAMVLGDAIHTAILEPERFEREYVFAPQGIDRRRKEGKQAWADFLEGEAHGKRIVGYEPVENRLYSEDARTVVAISDALRRNESLKPLLQGKGLTECSYAWDEEEPDAIALRMRCRPDRVQFTKRGTMLVDLKSCQDASPDAWRRTVERHRLYFQAAMYMQGYEAATGDRPTGFVHVCFEKEPPYAAAVYQLSDEYVTAGLHEYNHALDIVRECATKGEWPDYAKSAQVLEPSPWFMTR